MQKIVRRASLETADLPPALSPCFDLVHNATDNAPFAVFGGAIRDTRYWRMHSMPFGRINDYDIRICPESERVPEIVAKLGELAGSAVEIIPSAGTGRPRYWISDYHGAALDISFRPAQVALDKGITVQDGGNEIPSVSTIIAQERAANAVIGISGIAIDANGIGWETPEHLADCQNFTLSLFPPTAFPYPAAQRVSEYAKHLQTKFSNHQIVSITQTTQENSI